MAINWGILQQQMNEQSPQGLGQSPQQGVNWGQIGSVQQPARIIAQLPPSGDSGGGIGDALSGIAGLVGGLSKGISGAARGAARGAGSSAGNVIQAGNTANQAGGTIRGPVGQPIFNSNNQLFNSSNNPSVFNSSNQLNSPNLSGGIAHMGGPTTLSKDLMDRPAFQTGFQAHQQAIQNGVTKSPIMTVVDYSIPSNQKRMWVVDTQKNQVLMNTYVAQGKTTGFSNTPGSHQSSLGTFLATDPYHSQSMNRDALKLQGLDKGVNDNAFARGIVVHGGNYVGPDKQGTSWGCLTVPNSDAPSLIGLTKGGTIIHAYAPGQQGQQNFQNNLATPQGQKSFERFKQQSSPTRYEPSMSSQNMGIINNPDPVSSNHMFNSTANLAGQNVTATSQRPVNAFRQEYLPQNSNPELASTMAGIAHVESPGEVNPYNLEGPKTRKGAYAVGKYQIMSNEIPDRSMQALGYPITVQQFKNSPELQERITAYHVNKNLNQYGNANDAYSVWFSGRTAKKAGNAKDSFGTTVPSYIKKANQGALMYREQQQQLQGSPMTMNDRGNQYIDDSAAQQYRLKGQEGQDMDRMTSIDGNQDFQNNGMTRLASTTPYRGPLPNIPPFNSPAKSPTRDLTPKEIEMLMRSAGGGSSIV